MLYRTDFLSSYMVNNCLNTLTIVQQVYCRSAKMNFTTLQREIIKTTTILHDNACKIDIMSTALSSFTPKINHLKQLKGRCDASQTEQAAHYYCTEVEVTHDSLIKINSSSGS